MSAGAAAEAGANLPSAKAPASSSDWPPEGMETLGACPVCKSERRDPLHSGLRDRIFFCSPGAWDLHSCRDCGSGYLDPRPTAETIHLAYRDYHTHQEPVRVQTEKLHGLRRLKRVLANGYRNWRFGTDLRPSSLLGVLTAFLVPAQRAALERQYRHMPRRPGGGRVLDVGLGDGNFLDAAREMGWRVVGTDFDPEVVDNARRRGFDARLGTVDAVEGPFDVITMAHVIEHLHDPVAVLRECHRLLAPGGILWLETPNVGSAGLRRFGADWRGLEPPRHLVLFNRSSLSRALREAGFTSLRDMPHPSPVGWMYRVSTRIREGRQPDAPSPASLRLKLEIACVTLIEWLWRPSREFLAMTARKA